MIVSALLLLIALLSGLALWYDIVQGRMFHQAARELRRLATTAHLPADLAAAVWNRRSAETEGLAQSLLREAAAARDLSSLLQFQFSMLAGRLRGPQVIATSLTLLGLLGTVTGLIQSLRGVASLPEPGVAGFTSGGLETSVERIFSGLWTAFSTTLAGVLATLILRGANYAAGSALSQLWESYVPLAHQLAGADVPGENPPLQRDDISLLTRVFADTREGLAALAERLREISAVQQRASDVLIGASDSVESSIARSAREKEVIASEVSKFTAVGAELQHTVAVLARDLDSLAVGQRQLTDSVRLLADRSADVHERPPVPAGQYELIELMGRLVDQVDRLVSERTGSDGAARSAAPAVVHGGPDDVAGERRTPGSLVTLATPARFAKRAVSRVYVSCHTIQLREVVAAALAVHSGSAATIGSVGIRDIWNRTVTVKVIPTSAVQMEQDRKIAMLYPRTDFTLQILPADGLDTKAPIPVSLILSDEATGIELAEVPFEMRVSDFAFDHVSRLLVGRVLSGAMASVGVALASVQILSESGVGMLAGVPVAPLLILLGILVEVMNHIKYGRGSRRFESITRA